MLKIFSFTKRYMLAHKWRLALYVFIGIAMSTGSLVSPLIMGNFVDMLLAADDIGFIFAYFALFGGVSAVSITLGYAASMLYVYLQTQMGFAMNRDFIERIQRMPIKHTQKYDAAYLNQRVNNDSNALVIFCIGIIQSVLVNSAIVAAALVLLFSFHPPLAGVLMAVAAAYFSIYLMCRKMLYKANHEYKEAQSVFFGKLHEQLFNIRFIKLRNLFSFVFGRLDASFGVLLGKALKNQKASYVFGSLDQLVLIAAQMVLLLFGGIEIVEGRLTIGRFIIISSYFNMMLGAMRYFFGLGQTVQNNLVSYNRLQELQGIETEANGKRTLDRIESVELRGVTFGYGDSEVFAGISAVFGRGRIHVLLGPNGAGKSTLADVMVGLHMGDYGGEVLYNGVNIGELDMYSVRGRLVGFSEQAPTLLADTLAYNLCLDREGLLESKAGEMDRLVKALGLETYLGGLPGGLGTVVSDGAANISGGEKQKLSILRALLRDPDVIVLDEPTSALDERSCGALKDYLYGLRGEKIIVVITHDAGFAEDGAASVVRLLRDGRRQV